MSQAYSFAPIGAPSLIFRLGLALVVGAIIGYEREARSKPAGLRTNMLVSFGSALFVLIPIEIGAVQQDPDILGRAIAGVSTGVGFIGGGAIVRGSKIYGLTSAAAIWISAALGVAVGCGLWLMGLISALVTWLILKFVGKLETYI